METSGFTKKQQGQEVEYVTPYHWSLTDESWRGRSYYGYLRLALALGTEKLDADARILDAGCGDGRLVGLLQERGFTGVTGMDYSERALSFAAAFCPDARFAVADLTRELPAEAEQFDVAFCVETLEHIPVEDLPDVAAQLARVLKPGGRLIVTVPSVNVPVEKVGHKHYQHFSAESLAAQLGEAFIVDRVLGQDLAPGFVHKNLYRLLDNRWWVVKPLAAWYNQHVWPERFNETDPALGNRLVMRAIKK